MARGSRSLWVAIGAAVLLVTVVAVDASVTRSFSVAVETEEGWKTVAASGEEPYSYPRFGGEVTIEANRSETLRFQVTVDNEPPWTFDEAYQVRSNGRLVAEGTLTAGGGATAMDTFEVTVDELLRDQPGTKGDQRFVNIEMTTGDTFLYGSFTIDEVPQEGSS